ncbi:hypothetical protein LOAG_15760 [Loa loa]|uniref:Glycogen [starch] synthase n=1 Tax=Loa loa TaxID=7209 RepID=A0A1S0TEZ5_LOALO|nr:hypothetical protein LOAG_15760 [Loa loa]EFO12773.2 hypothetical protein LOAG_15760 [Loa loa]
MFLVSFTDAYGCFLSHLRMLTDVGGIYTVLRSKAPISTEEYGDQYCMLGPLRNGKWQLEVEQIAPESRHIATAIHKLKEGGFKAVYGRWLIDGYPKVVLFDLGSGSMKMNDWKHELYERLNFIDNEQDAIFIFLH